MNLSGTYDGISVAVSDSGGR